MVKDIVLNKSPKTFGYLKNTYGVSALDYLSFFITGNECQSNANMGRIIKDLGIV
jgi:hypothetical protein